MMFYWLTQQLQRLIVVTLCATSIVLSATSQAIEPPISNTSWDSKSNSVSGFLIGVGYWRELNEDFNIDNLLAIPEQELESAAIIDVKTNIFDARIRFEHMLNSGRESDHFEEENEVILQRIKLRWDLNQYADLTIGKLNEYFDKGQSFHPLDFFEDNLVGLDYENKRGRETGFPLINMSFFKDNWSARLIYSDDSSSDTTYDYTNINNGFNRGIRQWVGAFRYSVNLSSLNLIAQKPQHQEAGLGASFTQVFGNNVELYGAWFARRGTRIPIHRNIYLEQSSGYTASDVYINETPFAAYRINDNHLYQRWMLGGAWTSESLLTLTLELSHDDRGMDNDQWSYWNSVVDFHDNLNDKAARSINLAYDAEVLIYRRQDHLFLKAAKSFYDFNLTASSLIGVDGSIASGARVVYYGASEWEAWFDLELRTGKPESEFGSVSGRLGGTLGLRYFL